MWKIIRRGTYTTCMGEGCTMLNTPVILHLDSFFFVPAKIQVALFSRGPRWISARHVQFSVLDILGQPLAKLTANVQRISQPQPNLCVGKCMRQC